MESQKERLQQMFNYFNEYMSFIGKHDYVKDYYVRREKPYAVSQDKQFSQFNVQPYVQHARLTILPKAPQNKNKLKSELTNAVSSIMTPKNYEGGSTLMNLELSEEKEDGLREYELKIYYAPKIPVFDSEINKDEKLHSEEEKIVKD